MTETWQNGFRREVVTFLGRDGSAVQVDTGYSHTYVNVYGWQDWYLTEHMKECGLVFAPGGEIFQHNASQFEGTFTSNKDVTLLIHSGVSCQCGMGTDVLWGYAGTLGEVLHGILGVDIPTLWDLPVKGGN